MVSESRIVETYPLSPPQQGILFHCLLSPRTANYSIQVTCFLRGSIDLPEWEAAWQAVVDRHPSLRTSFAWQDRDEPLQVVHDRVKLRCIELDWSGLSPSEQELQIMNYLAADQESGFDLSHPPLMRLAMIRLAKDTFRMVWTHHHLLLDGWCNAIILRDLLAFYEALRRREELRIEPGNPYRTYVEWYSRQDFTQSASFWQGQLVGLELSDQIDGCSPDQNVHATSKYDDDSVCLTVGETSALRQFSGRFNLLMSTLIVGSWSRVLSRFLGIDEVLFGLTVSARPPSLPHIESTVGLFVNIIPVRVRVPQELGNLGWLRRLQEHITLLRTHEFMALGDILACAGIQRGIPIFESLVTLENFPVLDWPQQDRNGIELRVLRSTARTAYPLSLTVEPGEKCCLQITFDTARYSGKTVKELLRSIRTTLIHFVRQSSTKAEQFAGHEPTDELVSDFIADVE